MKLTTALNAYLADNTIEALTEIAEDSEPSTRPIVAAIILFGAGALCEWAAIMPHLLADVVNAGADREDLGAVFNGCNRPDGEARSMAWAAAALRLAAWADGVAA